MPIVQPVFSIARLLRPYINYDDDYQGQTTMRPIMFTEKGANEQGSPLDPQAGKAGFAPDLIRGLPVPFGSRVVVWIPIFDAYRYIVAWRARNLYDYRTERMPYHVPKQGQGVPDTSVVANQARVPIPAAWQPILYEGAEPAHNSIGTTSVYAGEHHINTGSIPQYGGVALDQPLVPGGAEGKFQQGIADPGVFGETPNWPTFVPIEMFAAGDEMLIGCYREATQADPTWDFVAGPPAGRDYTFFTLFNATTDLGVYVLTGSAP